MERLKPSDSFRSDEEEKSQKKKREQEKEVEMDGGRGYMSGRRIAEEQSN